MEDGAHHPRTHPAAVIFQFRRRSDHFSPYSRLFNDLPLSLVSSALPPPGLYNPLWFGLIPHLPLSPAQSGENSASFSRSSPCSCWVPLSLEPSHSESTPSIHPQQLSGLQSGQLWVGAVSLETLRVTACPRPWMRRISRVHPPYWVPGPALGPPRSREQGRLISALPE